MGDSGAAKEWKFVLAENIPPLVALSPSPSPCLSPFLALPPSLSPADPVPSPAPSLADPFPVPAPFPVDLWSPPYADPVLARIPILFHARRPTYAS